jgi:hypothetical protein
MKDIHLSVYGNPAQRLSVLSKFRNQTPRLRAKLQCCMECAPIEYSDLLLANGVYCHGR